MTSNKILCDRFWGILMTGIEVLYDRLWGIFMWPVMRYYMTGFEVLYDRIWGIILQVLRYFYVTGNEVLYDWFWGIIWPVLWGTFDVKFDVTVFSHSSPLLSNFSMLPFWCPRFFFDVLVFDIPVFSLSSSWEMIFLK